MKTFITLIAINQLLISSNLIPPSDPSYIFLYQHFRTSHDLSLYIRPYPYTMLEFEAIDSYDNNIFTSKQAVVGVIPGLRMWNDIPITTVNVWIAGSWENLSLLAEPVIVNDPYGLDLLGTDYVRSSIGGRITNAFIRYKNELISLQLGRSPVWWGQSWNHSIIQTGSGPTYDHLDLHLNFGSFQLEMLAGQLGSEFLYGKRIKRNIAGHRLTWLSKGGMFLAGFGEQIIYTGVSRGMEWTSINSWTYIHIGQFSSWQNCGHAIGYPYGPDLNSLHIQADMWISNTLLVNIEADWEFFI